MNSLDLRQFAAAPKPTLSDTGFLTSLLSKEINLFPKKFDERRKQSFFMELYSMVSSGVNLKTALEIIIAQEQEQKFKQKFEFLDRYVVEGNSFSDALRESGLFSAYEYISVKTGEETGRLDEVLRSLANFYSARIKQRRQLIAAISYPVVILVFSLVVVIFLMLVMIPMFASIFSKFNGELPAATKIVFALSASLQRIWLELLVMIITCVGIYVRIKDRAVVKSIRTRVVQRIPFFGSIYTSMAIAGFCRSMAFLISSKIPLNRCIQLQRELCTYVPIKKELSRIEIDLINGSALHSCFARVPEFNLKLISMVRIGEEINQLDKFFNALADQYSAETDFQISQMNALLEPFLIIFLGFIVGFILMTMYLPMFQLSSSFSQ